MRIARGVPAVHRHIFRRGPGRDPMPETRQRSPDILRGMVPLTFSSLILPRQFGFPLLLERGFREENYSTGRSAQDSFSGRRRAMLGTGTVAATTTRTEAGGIIISLIGRMAHRAGSAPLMYFVVDIPGRGVDHNRGAGHCRTPILAFIP